MIAIDKESLLTVEDVTEYLPRVRRGKKIHKATVYRWMNKGVRGIKLECLRVGGATMTSVEAVQRFSERLSQQRPVVNRPQAEEAESKLKAFGF